MVTMYFVSVRSHENRQAARTLAAMFVTKLWKSNVVPK